MLGQILWLDAVLKLACGLPLVLLPGASLKAAGLPGSAAPLLARLLGAALCGMALALALEPLTGRTSGLGPGGAALINLSGALVLGLAIVSGRAEAPFRGRLLLWVLVAAMALLAALELPHA
jgi:hypothetical protein